MKLSLKITESQAVYPAGVSSISRAMGNVNPDRYEDVTHSEVNAEGHPFVIAGHLRALAAHIESESGGAA